MEKYEKREDHPLKKYIGQSVSFSGEEVEVVGYYADMSSIAKVIIDAAQTGGWTALEPNDVIFKECESYWYLSVDELIEKKIMIRNKDFAIQYAGRAVFNKNGEYAGVVVGWNDMHGVILGVGHADGWQSWGLNDTRVSDEEFSVYVYCNAGMLVEPVAQLESVEVEAPKHKTIGELIKEHEGVQGIQFSTDEHGNVQAAYIRSRHGAMQLVSMGDGLENVSSKI